MRRFPSYPVLLPLLLLLATACAKVVYTDRPVEEANGVSLSLSVASTRTLTTKMTAVITQDGAGFRGIEQVHVVPFHTVSAVPVSAGNARLGARNVYIENSAIDQTGLVANNNSHLYNTVSMPRNTNRVLAYGKAFDSGDASTKEGKHRNGVLTPYGLDDPDVPGDISFGLESVLETADLTEINQTADNLIAALNGVVEVLQSSGDAEIQAFLDAFAAENVISACSYQTLYRFEQNILGALSHYAGTNPDAINAVMIRVSALQSARNAAGSGFPSSYGIPEGAVGMWWNGHRFVKLVTGVNISLVPMEQYCYPPSLWYYANSPIKTSADDSVRDQYRPQNATWASILAYYDQGSTVTANTRSVAIVDQMQYGDGLVEFRFVAPTGNAVAAAGCPLTGIIIGDQKDVDFCFAPKSASTDWFVYDNNMGSITLGSTSQYVQVLVLPTADNQSVHFALEFQNNTSSSFPCQQGTVQSGCRFYLAGELNLAEGTMPPGETLSSIFGSDHKTTVYLQVDNLDHAYNTVPDLRDPQLEIGVTATMDWLQVEPGGIKLPF